MIPGLSGLVPRGGNTWIPDGSLSSASDGGTGVASYTGSSAGTRGAADTGCAAAVGARGAGGDGCGASASATFGASACISGAGGFGGALSASRGGGGAAAGAGTTAPCSVG